MSVLSAEDLRFFDEQGYVVVREAVPVESCERLIAQMWQFLEKDPANIDHWYRAPLPPNGMLEMYQNQALWDNRQNERVYGAFVDIWKNPNLWVTFDRANLKVPRNDKYPEYSAKGFLHWDMDVTTIPHDDFGVQGVLYLADTDTNTGGFLCAPGHHKVLEEWAKTRRPDETRPDMSGVEVIPITGKAGDLVIWNRRLYHGNGENTSDRPRFAQYIAMLPAPAPGEQEDWRQERLREFNERDYPHQHWTPGDPREWERTHCPQATLSALGRRLLGAEAWE